MRIRRLKLGGFKSFVESAELRIEPGLTGIVGPNGCGKSNLLEAIRWVMGEGSPKSLRGSGMEDVIFAGTATRPARDFAEVSLLIERSADEVVEGQPPGESEVTRRIERGAGSAYRLNGRDVRQKDVALLFADAATGAHSPALVSQGRIGAVIAAKPVERRQMLEEAAGISGLHARRKDAEQKLRAAEANIVRLDELLGDQEARVAALRRQARAAERYKSLTDKIRAAEARLLFARWRDADLAAQKAVTQSREAAEAVSMIQSKMVEAQERQEDAVRLANARRTALEEQRDRGRSLAHDLATARARRDAVSRRLQELERLAAALTTDSDREQALRADADKAVTALDDERRAIAARLSDGAAQAEKLAAELNHAETESRAAEAELAGLMAREAAMAAERRVALAALDAARNQAERSSLEARRIDEQVAALGNDDVHRGVRDAAEKNASDAAAALAAAEQALASADRDRSNAADERDQAEAALAAARAEYAAATSERNALANALTQVGTGSLPVRAKPGFERALAAALGDDLEAGLGNDGPRRWAGAPAATDDPTLPAASTMLADVVDAPAELSRRLRQIAVVDADDGQLLAVGQRLVTKEGVLRRWDGFVAVGGGGATAERLIRANRLMAIDSALPALEAEVSGATHARDHAAAAVEGHRQSAENARHVAAAADRQARDAARAIDGADSAIERLSAQRASLQERRADLEPLLDASRQLVACAQEALDGLPDPAILAGEIDAARTAATAAGENVADCRAAAATRGRELAATRERDAAAEREQEEWRVRGKAAAQRVIDAAERADAIAQERTGMADEPQLLDSRIAELERDHATSDQAIAKAQAATNETEEVLAALQRAMAEAGEAFAKAREARAGAVARAEAQEARRIELGQECGEKFECPPPLLPRKFGFDDNALAPLEQERETFERLSAERERIGPVNLVAESELAELELSRTAGAAERDELQEAINRLRGSIGNLNREGRIRLLDAFEKVDGHFRSLFTTLFNGGQAHLELVESDDPLEAGLEIMAQPPGKRLTALTLLSGGEQALTAIALIFALFLTNPAPICVLDEVDAPLDDANVDRFCDLLDRMTAQTETRYLIVTHNAVTMARMHRLYGVTMIEKGVSRLVSVDLGGAEQFLAAE
ncbi:MAG: chromosome segregation protein SMC [Sphingomicrobium sp.]